MNSQIKRAGTAHQQLQQRARGCLEDRKRQRTAIQEEKGAALPLQAPKRLQVSCPMKNFIASQRAAANTPYATVAAEQRTLDRKSLIVTSFYRRRRSR